MFLRILLFVVSTVVVAYVFYRLYSRFETVTIVPLVCRCSIAHGQRYLVDNGRGFFKQYVDAAIKSEHYIRTSAFIVIDLVVAVMFGLVIPSNWAFWLVPPWAIKVGMVVAMLVETFVDLVVSGNVDSRVGYLESIDDSGKYYFRGEWMDDFIADIDETWKKEDRPPVGRKYIVLEYLGFFCTAPLDLAPQG